MIVLHEKIIGTRNHETFILNSTIQIIFCIYAWAIGPREEEIQTSMTFSVQDEKRIKKLFSHSEKI